MLRANIRLPADAIEGKEALFLSAFVVIRQVAGRAHVLDNVREGVFVRHTKRPYDSINEMGVLELPSSPMDNAMSAFAVGLGSKGRESGGELF